MRTTRVPLSTEPIDGAAAVNKYDRYAALFMRPEYRLTARKIARHTLTGGRILDIGTGSGRLAVELAVIQPHCEIIGLDISLDMLKEARSRTALRAGQNALDYVQATAARLPFTDESFEVVTSYASLHHWQQPALVFNEIWRITRQPGWIIIRDNRRMLGNPFYRCGVGLISLFMESSERGRWPKSIMASYTVEEVRAILAQSRMKDSRVYSDMGGFDLCIECRK